MKEIQSTNSKALFEAGRDVLSNACIGYRCVYSVQHSLERLNSEPGLIYFPGATKVGPSYLLGDGHFSHGIDPLLESCLAFRECHATFDHWIVSNAQAVGEFGRNGWPLLFYWIQSIADEVCEHFGECRSCLEWETAETNKWLERQRLANDPPMGIPNDWFDYFFDENDRRALKAMMHHIRRLLRCLRSIELFTDDEPLIARWQLEYTNARSAEARQPVVVENPFDPNAELSHEERLEIARADVEDIQGEIMAYCFLKKTSGHKDVLRWGEDGFPMDRIPPIEDKTAKSHLETLRHRVSRLANLATNANQVGDEQPNAASTVQDATYKWPDEYERDKWIYENYGVLRFSDTVTELEKMSLRNKWSPVVSRAGIRKIADRFAAFHGLEKKRGRQKSDTA